MKPFEISLPAVRTQGWVEGIGLQQQKHLAVAGLEFRGRFRKRAARRL
jgi:hypothetical protein